MAAPPLSNSFEGGSQGTTITTGNSGGSSGNAFDAISNPGSGAIIFDNAHGHNTLAMKITTAASSNVLYAEWQTLGNLTTDIWFRQYLYLTAYAPIILYPGGCADSSGTKCMNLVITSSGIVQIADAAGTNNIAPGSVAVSLNTLVRIEWRVRSAVSNGQVEWRLYNSAEATTITDTNSTSTIGLTASLDRVRWGVSETSAPTSYALWLDDVAASTVDWLGPSAAPRKYQSHVVPFMPNVRR